MVSVKAIKCIGLILECVYFSEIIHKMWTTTYNTRFCAKFGKFENYTYFALAVPITAVDRQRAGKQQAAGNRNQVVGTRQLLGSRRQAIGTRR